MGSDLGDGWSSDNRIKSKPKITKEIKVADKHQLYFAKEKRRGRVVTIVKPFYLAEDDLKALLKSLKKELGSGGTIKPSSFSPSKIHTIKHICPVLTLRSTSSWVN